MYRFTTLWSEDEAARLEMDDRVVASTSELFIDEHTMYWLPHLFPTTSDTQGVPMQHWASLQDLTHQRLSLQGPGMHTMPAGPPMASVQAPEMVADNGDIQITGPAARIDLSRIQSWRQQVLPVPQEARIQAVNDQQETVMSSNSQRKRKADTEGKPEKKKRKTAKQKMKHRQSANGEESDMCRSDSPVVPQFDSSGNALHLEGLPPDYAANIAFQDTRSAEEVGWDIVFRGGGDTRETAVGEWLSIDDSIARNVNAI